MSFSRKAPCLVALAALVAACQSPLQQEEPAAPETAEPYFSTRDFLDDQLQLLHGSLYSLRKELFLNGQPDSAYVTLQSENWAPVYAVFADMDISHPRYAGKYRFTFFEDPATFTNNYVYEATDPRLPVRRLLVTADAGTRKITSVLGDREAGNFWTARRQRLYYLPLKLLQIQEEVHAKIGADKTFRVAYRFLINRSDEE